MIDEWLETLDQWLRTSKNKPRLFRCRFDGLQGQIRVDYSRRSSFVSAAYSIHCDEFDKFVFGRVCDGGILILQSGMLSPPYISANAQVEDNTGIAALRESIRNESETFFDKLNTLQSVYSELISDTPTFSRADPRAPQMRAMHASVVAHLMGLDWRPDMDRAQSVRTDLSREWIAEVRARLESS